MKILVQRVGSASVTVEGRTVGRIDKGILALVGVGVEDTAENAIACARKVRYLRLFQQAEMELKDDVVGTGGAILVISQFTLMASTLKGRRPSFNGAAAGPIAEPLVVVFRSELERLGARTEGGIFGAKMQVALVNDGPMTLMIEL